LYGVGGVSAEGGDCAWAYLVLRSEGGLSSTEIRGRERHTGDKEWKGEVKGEGRVFDHMGLKKSWSRGAKKMLPMSGVEKSMFVLKVLLVLAL
jgi:hypothetical protein